MHRPAANSSGHLLAFLAIALLAGVQLARAVPLPQQAELEVLHVQGNVYVLVGAAANVAVQVGNDGVLVVDTGGPGAGDAVLRAIRTLSDGPIRWMVNTHAHIDHTGGNAVVSQAGETVNGNPAAIVAHENVPLRMVEMDRPSTERPVNTFFESERDFYFNGEAIFLYHIPEAHTDGDIMVYFRDSDVLVSGDVFMTTTFPVIDLALGGGVDGFIEGMNRMLDITVPAHLQDGGTYVIPGHGRVSDEADVVEYRDMVQIIRDRIQAMIAQGMTLAEVTASDPTLDYRLRYGNPARFIEEVYRSLGGE